MKHIKKKQLYNDKVVIFEDPPVRHMLNPKQLQNSYKITEVCTERCFVDGGNVEHQHNQNERLVLKFV